MKTGLHPTEFYTQTSFINNRIGINGFHPNKQSLTKSLVLYIESVTLLLKCNVSRLCRIGCKMEVSW
jgi:hypothetical protein